MSPELLAELDDALGELADVLDNGPVTPQLLADLEDLVESCEKIVTGSALPARPESSRATVL